MFDLRTRALRVACVLIGLLLLTGTTAVAETRHAAIVVDANSGKVLYEQFADEKRHPASLTKMMTLYLVFEAIEQGRLGYSSRITVSEKATSVAPSKLDLEAGEEIALLSDETGELEFRLLPANGIGDGRALTDDGDVLRFGATPSPDGRFLASAGFSFPNALEIDVSPSKESIALNRKFCDSQPSVLNAMTIDTPVSPVDSAL